MAERPDAPKQNGHPTDAAAAAPPAPGEPWCEITASRGLGGWLAEHRVALALTTYQTGKLFFIGQRQGQLSVFERTFNRCLGMWSDGQTIWMSSLYQLIRFENALRLGETHDGYDRVYVPKSSETTADLDVHDVGVDASGRVVFVATKFSCLATTSRRHSFTPLWRPPFVSKLAPEDRCHMNGLAFDQGKPAYVTVVSRSDALEGWRTHRRDGGCILSVPGGEVVASGLSMPHSPRVKDGKIFVLESGTGTFGHVDRATGKLVPMTFCPGYARGMAFVGHYALVGLSRPRGDAIFGGLALDDELSKRQTESRCGILVIDMRSGDIVEWLRFEKVVTELFDVVTLPGAGRPMALGFKTDEISRTISIDDPRAL